VEGTLDDVGSIDELIEILEDLEYLRRQYKTLFAAMDKLEFDSVKPELKVADAFS